MRTTFALLLCALTVASVIWWRFQPKPRPGITELVWVTDLNPLRQAQADLFNRDHPHTQVNLDPAGGVDKIIVQSMGGIGPDFFDAFDPFELSAYVQGGIAWDITDALAKRGVDLSKVAYKGILPTCIVDGRTYGVPTNLAADAIWFHRDILAKAGVPEHHGPWTWAEFIPIAQKLTIRDAQGHPVQYGFEFEWWQWHDFFVGYNAHIFSHDGAHCELEAPEAIDAVTMMRDLVYKYRVSSTPVEDASMATAGGFGSGGMSIFGAKHAAIALGGRWWLAQLRTYKGLDLGVMEGPYGTVRQFYAYGRSSVINKASPNREAALDFLLYQTGAGYNNLVNRQADGISAYPFFNEGQAFLSNAEYPEETYNAVWRDVATKGVGADASPFISGQIVNQIIKDQLDLVQSGDKSPAAAMHDAASQINTGIQRNIRESPALAKRYMATVGHP